MGRRDPRIDAYIEKSADFARPVLRHIRDVVHAACPDVEETMKWSFPHFDYKGIMASMAAFKEHCTLGFWHAEEVVGPDAKDGAMGQFGRITSMKDLPATKVLTAYVKQAAALKDAGVKPKRAASPRKAAKPGKAADAPVPDDLGTALKRNEKAATAFRDFSPSHRREYVEWITEAKRAETRAKRVSQTVAWLAEGKPRNWKYL
ncbi:MAG TPA: YdeI/OmpD-associated family protein [Longimicrobiales bacterium]|nr:YdeI/OmpD-associated family protein [Longimicrobiales bacterium]